MENTDEIKRWKALVKLDINQAADEFCKINDEDANSWAVSAGIEYMAQSVLSKLSTDIGSVLIRKLEPELKNSIIELLEPEKNFFLKRFLPMKRVRPDH